MQYGELLFYTSLDAAALSKHGIKKTSTLTKSCTIDVEPATPEAMVTTMTHFFAGNGTHTAGQIIGNWWNHPYGHDATFSQNIPYFDLKDVQSALSTFALHVTVTKLVEEAEDAVKTSNGLHVSISGKSQTVKKVDWMDIGATTFESTETIQKKHQPTTRYILTRISQRQDANFVRKKRPVNMVSLSIRALIITSDSAIYRLSQISLAPSTSPGHRKPSFYRLLLVYCTWVWVLPWRSFDIGVALEICRHIQMSPTH